MSQATEPPKTQTRLETAENTFRLLVESVKDYGIFMLDLRGNIVTWNQGAAQMKGYSAQEVIGKNFSLFYTKEDRDRHHPEDELKIALEVGRYEEEGWRLRKDGGRFWTNVVITRLNNDDGIPIGFSKVTRDLTERKHAEDQLRASEEKARMVYESVKDYAIITLDAHGNIATWNEGAQRIKGYFAKEIIGKHFSRFYLEEDVQNGKCEYELREATMTGRFEDEGWRVRKNGTKFWANVVITALYHKDGAIRGFSKVTRDITERKRSEDLLKMANEGLERRVQERTLELEQAIASRDEFLSIASHELRTPITPLKLQLQRVLDHLRKGDLSSVPSEKLEKIASSLDRSMSRLVKLVDNLLDVARINAGKIELHPEEINVCEVILEACSHLNQEAQLIGTPIQVNCPSSIVGILDQMRLEQVVTNLTVNAMKYGNGNPILITITQKNSRLYIEVKDEGLGIAEEDQVRVFNRFEQVSTNGARGLGLGLYITKQIVDSQHGKITLKSKHGVGSIFTVELPLKEIIRGNA